MLQRQQQRKSEPEAVRSDDLSTPPITLSLQQKSKVPVWEGRSAPPTPTPFYPFPRHTAFVLCAPSIIAAPRRPRLAIQSSNICVYLPPLCCHHVTVAPMGLREEDPPPHTHPPLSGAALFTAARYISFALPLFLYSASSMSCDTDMEGEWRGGI